MKENQQQQQKERENLLAHQLKQQKERQLHEQHQLQAVLQLQDQSQRNLQQHNERTTLQLVEYFQNQQLQATHHQSWFTSTVASIAGKPVTPFMPVLQGVKIHLWNSHCCAEFDKLTCC